MDYNLIYQELLSFIKNSKLSYDVRESLNEIYNDKELIDSINRYNLTKDLSLRKEIYNNEKFRKYKHLENEVNMLILKLNKIFNESSDNDENN